MKRRSLFQSALAWALLLCMLVGLMPGSVFATQEGEAPKAETKAATSYASQIASLATPYNEEFTGITSVYSYVQNNPDFHYYIVYKESNTKGHVLTMNKPHTGKYYPSTDVQISGTKLTKPDPDCAVNLLWTSANRCAIYPTRGIYTRIITLEIIPM